VKPITWLRLELEDRNLPTDWTHAYWWKLALFGEGCGIFTWKHAVMEEPSGAYWEPPDYVTVLPPLRILWMWFSMNTYLRPWMWIRGDCLWKETGMPWKEAWEWLANPWPE
jgi:hypothetical protein